MMTLSVRENPQDGGGGGAGGCLTSYGNSWIRDGLDDT